MTRAEMESRRLKAAGDLIAGVPQFKVAKIYRVSQTTVSRWVETLEGFGRQGMKSRSATGRPARLNAEQMAEIRLMYLTNNWRYRSMANEISRRFGVEYHVDHVGRILKRLGLTKRKKKAA